MKLAPVVPDSVEERHAYQLACERRGLRQKRERLEAEAVAALSTLAERERARGAGGSGGGGGVGASEGEGGRGGGEEGGGGGDLCAAEAPEMRKACAEEMTELVLPQHANHHGNTFGGQVLAY